MQQTLMLDLDWGTAAVFSNRCPQKPTPNEDAAAIVRVDDSTLLLVVADGMGGGPAGGKASAIAVETVAQSCQASAADEQPARVTILDAFELANRRIRDLNIGCATTLVVLEVKPNLVRCFHVGDSLGMAMGNRGKVRLQTISHSPVGYAIEAGILDETEAMFHIDRHLVSNMMGVDDMRLDVGPAVSCGRRDTLLVCSDGLSDNLFPNEVIELLRKGDLRRQSIKLASIVEARMSGVEQQQPNKPDDLTFIAFRFKNKKA
jgi:serine/threonine protein phosphatase PrpC